MHAAEEALQLHGGIGMTWEHPVHLRLKRAKADQLAFGTAGRHRARIAALVDLVSRVTVESDIHEGRSVRSSAEGLSDADAHRPVLRASGS